MYFKEFNIEAQSIAIEVGTLKSPFQNNLFRFVSLSLLRSTTLEN